MVNPLYLIALLLASAFLHPLIARVHKKAGAVLVTAVLAAGVLFPLQWLTALDASAMQSFVFQTAGFKAPISINLQVGIQETLFLLLINGGAFLNVIYSLSRGKKAWNDSSQILLMTLLLGVNGLILSRDLFNMFVFMEISSISLYALVASKNSGKSFEAGIKLMIAGGIASAFYLIGVIFLYRITGTLNLDDMIAKSSMLDNRIGMTAVFFVAASLLIELKPFPANGWGADVYQAADTEVSSLVSGASATAVFFVLYKIMPLFNLSILQVAALSGGATFLFSQLLALKQDSVRRMLGYSSIGQIGLLVLVASVGTYYGDMLSARLFGGIFLPLLLLAGNHLFSKIGLFWVTGITGQKSLATLGKNKGSAVGIAVQGILTSALAGFPPFPAFWAKWALVTGLVSLGAYSWSFIILLGSLIEAVYLFRWFLKSIKDTSDDGAVHDEIIEDDFAVPAEAAPEAEKGTFGLPWLAPTLSSIVLAAAGGFLSLLFLMPGEISSIVDLIMLLPLAALLIWTLLDLLRIPLKIQILLAIAASAAYGYFAYTTLDGIREVFALIFIAGSAVQMIALMNRKGRHTGLTGMLVTMVFSLGSLIYAQTTLQFFFSWELMTISSFFLVVRGQKSSAAGLRYLTFSLAGAFSILAALALGSGAMAAVLFGVGFLVKMGAIGLHIWLPGAYAESDDDVSTFFSSVLSKAGLLMLFLLSGVFSQNIFPSLSSQGILGSMTFTDLLGWIGVVTAFAGAFLALFKEDIKYTLAYSSMGQVGYMLLSYALMTQLGWMNSLYLAVTHLLFKGMLFIAISGVIYRTQTRLMYKMGGLISRMPVTFFTVLIGIIALSGVPPLTGFGSKWMLYTALIEKGWYLQAAIAMFASGIAFLYLFRLIHVIFLGQLKDEHRDIKEAPLWFLIPQIIGIIGIMFISVYPSAFLKVLEKAVSPYFPTTISWEGYTVLSTLGYWNGTAVMFVTIGVFLAPLIWLLIVQRKHTQKVGQFNIVYAAERPYKPETTHYGYNFFAPYEKALGFLKAPLVTNFWGKVVSIAEVTGSAVRRLYSGNIQTYALWIVLYTSILLLIIQRGM